MANPPKQKGTRFESELVHAFEDAGLHAERTAPGLPYDLRVSGNGEAPPVEALVTRPDRGRSLVTIPLADFIEYLTWTGRAANVEAKRYARFALHTIYEGKFK